MKILFYIYSLNKGGAERVLLTLAEELNRKKDVETIILTDVIEEREYRLPTGIRRVIISDYMYDSKNNSRCFLKKILSLSSALNRLLAIRRCCEVEKPDKVVAFMVSGAIRAIRANYLGGYPVIVAVRSNPYEEYGDSRSHRRLLNIFRHAEKIICQTEFQRNFFSGDGEKYNYLPLNKCKVIYNPIFAQFCLDRDWDSIEPIIVATGRLYDYKNHKLLINAFAQISDLYPKYRLVIYGEGPYRRELEEEIKRLANNRGCGDLLDKISLPGDSDDVARDIINASMYVLPSDTEGMPNGLMEAMALGMPCIATDCPCGGPRSLIKDGINGVLVPVGDCVAMANAISYLLESYDIRYKLGEEAVKIRELCDAKKIADQWYDVLCV